MRRKAKVHEDIEFYSVMRTIRAIEEADVNVLMLDATEQSISAQDLQIIHLIQRHKKGCVVVINKWDLMDKETNTARDFEKEIHERMAPFTDVPIIFTSATTKQRIFKAMETALEVYENKEKRIKVSLLNNVMLEIIEKYPPPAHRGHHIKIKYVTQLKTVSPTFIFFCNHPQHVKEAYRRYLENRLREKFTFTGVPLTLLFRKK